MRVARVRSELGQKRTKRSAVSESAFLLLADIRSPVFRPSSGSDDKPLPGTNPVMVHPWFRSKRMKMADGSAIEWTDATWNPVTGCTKISVGCDNCYAARFSELFRDVPGHPFEAGFDLTLRPDRLQQPFGWKRPRMIFVN